MRDHPGRTGALCLMAWWIMFTYGLARPAALSMFLADYGQRGLPAVWLAVAGLAIAITAIYNRFSRKVAMNRVASAVATVSGIGYVLLLLLEAFEIPHVSFVLYAFTDLYIVVLVEVFWSLCNFVYPVTRAKWAYGLFLAAGSGGAVVGGLLVEQLGVSAALWCATGILLVVAVSVLFFYAPMPPATSVKSEILHSLETVAKSRYLTLVIILIAVTQVVITLVDYQYNGVVARAYPDEDARAAFVGRVDASINSGAIILQALAGPILSFGGVGTVLVGIPLLLLGCMGWLAMSPALPVMVITKISSKVMDYSLFRTTKEILYIPLSYSEKTQGKAVADILGYRVAKAGASVVLLFWAATRGALTVFCLALGVIWFALAVALAERFTKTERTQSEHRDPTGTSS